MLWTVALGIFIIVLVIVRIFLKKKEQAFGLASYQKKARVMNESEQALFINLRKALGDDYILLSKVRMEDFVVVNKNYGIERNKLWGLRGRIKSRHVDFLICDRATTAPVLAIELDGKSHNGLSRQKRDQFVDELYKTINLQVEHIHVGGSFLELAQEIRGKLNGKINK
jgi:hypothetical protein